MPRMRSSMGSGVFRVPNSGGSSTLFLAQSVSAPLELWGVTAENSNYKGPLFQIQRADNGSILDIGRGSNGKDADATALAAAIAGSSGLLRTVYGQMGVADLVQATTANMPTAQVGADGKVEFVGGSNKWLETTSASLKTAKVHAFMIAKHPYANSLSLLISGCLFCYGGAGSYFTVARYGLGLEWTEAAAIEIPRNGQSGGFNSAQVQGAPGEAYKGKYSCYDCSINTFEFRADTAVMIAGGANTDITYPSTDKFIVGNDNGNNNPFSGSWRCLAFYSATQSSSVRDSISTFLMDSSRLATRLENPVFTPKAPGFKWAPIYVPTYGVQIAADANNINWINHHGGYPWSYWQASNVSNGASYVRFEVRPTDSDVVINDSERCEQAGFLGGNTTSTGVILPGDDFEIFAQLLIEAGAVNQTGDWADLFQVHYDDLTESPNTADLVLLDCKGGNMQPSTQRNEIASGNRTARGSSVPIQYDTWFAYLIQGHWDVARGSADTLKFYLSVNGGTMTNTFNGTGAFFDTNAINAYLKRGIYRGFPNTNSGNLALHIANYKFSKTAGAFSSFITSQPALPTHV